MMSPLERFLGLPPDASDAKVLGLEVSPRRLTASQVDAALAERLGRLSRHPDSESAGAERVRARLLEAAARLRPRMIDRRGVAPIAGQPDGLPTEASFTPFRPSETRTEGGADGAAIPLAETGGDERAPRRPDVTPRRPAEARPKAPLPPVVGERSARRGSSGGATPAAASMGVRVPAPPVTLTAFDRAVLALLVAGGGWNARSRALLVAMATARGVSPQALVRIVRGLAGHVGAGDGRPAPGDLSRSLVGLQLRAAREPTRLEKVVEQVEAVVGDELRSDRLASRFRVTVVFALLTLISGAFLLRILLTPAVAPPAPARATSVAEVAPAPVVQPSAHDPAATDGQSTAQGEPTVRPLPAAGRSPLRGDRRPAEATRAAEGAAALGTELAEIGRRVSLADDRLPEVLRQQWIAALADAGTGWPLLPVDRRQALVEAIVEVVRAASVPSVVDALLGGLESRAGTDEPLDLWRRAFAVGTLAELLRSGTTLTPVTTVQAARLLEGWTGAIIPVGEARFDHAVALFLDRAATELTRVNIESPTVPEEGVTRQLADRWEAWFEAWRSISPDGRIQVSLLPVIERLLRSGRDLAAPGPVAALLVRLTIVLDAAVPEARAAILGWYGDESISSDAMWVFTSVLHANRKPPELASTLLIDWNSTIETRRALRDRLSRGWPEPSRTVTSARPLWLAVPEAMRDRWYTERAQTEAYAREAIAAGEAVAQARAVLMASMVNEAVAFIAAGDERGAEERVRIAGELRSGPDDRLRRHPLRRAALPQGRAAQNDGGFAEAFRGDRDIEAKLARLRAVRQDGVTDMGPQDAVELVRAALRGAQPAEVRSQATAMLADQFEFGPQVMRTTLDMLPDAVISEELSETITRITGRSLPPARSAGWLASARRAMLEHVISLHDDDLSLVDLYAENIAESVRQRLDALSGGGGSAFVREQQPQAVIGALVDAWRERAGTILVAQPLEDLTAVDRRRSFRRRFADSGIARFVAEQATLLELAAHVVAGEVPALQPDVERVLRDAAEERERAHSGLAQAVLTEVALTRLWHIAFGGDASTLGDGLRWTGDLGPEPSETSPAPVSPDGPTSDRPNDGGPVAVPRRPIQREQVPPPGLEPPEAIPSRRPQITRTPRRSRRVTRLPASRVGPSPMLPLLVAIVAGMLVWSDSATAVAPDVGGIARWESRLRALRPEDPEAYLLLGEDVADAATTPGERDLASELFRRAGALDPTRFGHSACLALADLADDRVDRRRFRAAAALLESGGTMPILGNADERSVDPAAALKLSEALGQLRLGQGQITARLLQQAEVRALLAQVESRLPGGSGRVDSDSSAYRGGTRMPTVQPRELLVTLRVELGLLAQSDAPWTCDIALDDRPLVEVDPQRIDEFLGVDVRRSLWRDGRWVAK